MRHFVIVVTSARGTLEVPEPLDEANRARAQACAEIGLERDPKLSGTELRRLGWRGREACMMELAGLAEKRKAS